MCTFLTASWVRLNTPTDLASYMIWYVLICLPTTLQKPCLLVYIHFLDYHSLRFGMSVILTYPAVPMAKVTVVSCSVTLWTLGGSTPWFYQPALPPCGHYPSSGILKSKGCFQRFPRNEATFQAKAPCNKQAIAELFLIEVFPQRIEVCKLNNHN